MTEEQLTATCCNETYHRGAEGVWRYPWGDAVPGAEDLLLSDVLADRDPIRFGGRGPLPPASPEELEWATGLCGIDSPITVRHRGRRDLVVGLSAPELVVARMLTVSDIADLSEVSKATIDSYRYRGYLPEPQLVKGRTPLWAAPVVHHWLDNRPGAGWRTDVYGRRERCEPQRTLPISRARAASLGSDAPTSLPTSGRP